MRKKIISVEFEFPSYEIESVSFLSDQSLFDADLIIFEPKVLSSCTGHTYSKHQGKHLIDEEYSVKIREAMEHWRSELTVALKAGRTIIVFLPRLEEFYLTESGNINPFEDKILSNNFAVLPFQFNRIIPKGGTEIKVAGNLGALSTYWDQFSSNSKYQVYLEANFESPILTTKKKEKVVGAIVQVEKGTMLLLPALEWNYDEFIIYHDDGGEEWTPKAINWGKRLISCLIEVDKTIRSNQAATPPPEWTKSAKYQLGKEVMLNQNLTDLTQQIEKLKIQQTKFSEELKHEGKLRWLLYEQGECLEEVVRDALTTMGFKTEHYQKGESEFDAIFTSGEGRCLGEFEGKDSKAINIDKLSQLERNLQEDFARDGVSEYAKGVLFGNAFRLKPLSERGEFFTQKCISGARRSQVALVRTPDLFTVTRYLKEHKDPKFAMKCRKAILQANGEVVVFPKIPKTA